jgi:hypothetical protein
VQTIGQVHGNVEDIFPTPSEGIFGAGGKRSISFKPLVKYNLRLLKLGEGKMRLFFLGLALVAFCAGCATTPIPVKEAKPVPADRVFRSSSIPKNGNVTVLFVRDTGFVGSGVYHHLFIDGRKAASLNPGEKIELVLPPGEHIFGVTPTDPFGNAIVNSIDQDLKPDRKYYYRLQTDGNDMRTVIQRYVPEYEGH